MSALLTAAGCGTLLYKAGGSASDYETARNRCRNQGHTKSPDFERCMAEQGWAATQLEPPGPNTPPATAPAEPPATRPPDTPAAGAQAPSSTVRDAPASARPLIVKNWFKLGASAADLDAARKRCATTLGVAADDSATASLAVTPAMLECLRNEGWHAFLATTDDH